MAKEKTDEVRMRKNTALIVAIILGVLLIGALGYIGLTVYQEGKQKNQESYYNSGLNAGYEYALSQLVSQASTCSSVPVTYNNVTLTMVALECYK